MNVSRTPELTERLLITVFVRGPQKVEEHFVVFMHGVGQLIGRMGVDLNRPPIAKPQKCVSGIAARETHRRYLSDRPKSVQIDASRLAWITAEAAARPR